MLKLGFSAEGGALGAGLVWHQAGAGCSELPAQANNNSRRDIVRCCAIEYFRNFEYLQDVRILPGNEQST